MLGRGVLGFDFDFLPPAPAPDPAPPSPLMAIFGFLGGGGDPSVDTESPSVPAPVPSFFGVISSDSGNGNFGAMGGGFDFVFVEGSVPSFGILDFASCASRSACRIRVSSDGGPETIVSILIVLCMYAKR